MDNQTCPTPTSPSFPTNNDAIIKYATLPPKYQTPFQQKLAQMALPLAPLVQLSTGHIHPVFPSCLLNFWLLTEVQCDSLAHFYHQRTPNAWAQHYPCPITWRDDLTLEEKRRKIGKFIGLRGCETPTAMVVRREVGGELEWEMESVLWGSMEVEVDGDGEGSVEWRMETTEEIERKARRARAKEEEEEVLKRKLWWLE